MAAAGNSRVLQVILLPIVVMLFCSFAHGNVIYVDNDGQADFDNIQAGIDGAVDGDTVLVASGEYVITEPITFRGKTITVKSEAGRDATTIRMGTPADTNRGSVMVFENGETDASILEGFTITGGRGSWFPSVNAFGAGGILFNASSATVRDCAIVQNSTDYGGGIGCAYACSPRLIDCTIAENLAGMHGGGVFVWNRASLILINCIISGNSTTGATALVAGYGGGLSCMDNSSLTLTNCTIAKNSAGFSAGGVICYKSLATLRNCIIADNSAARLGGAIFCETDSSMTVNNCIISRNSARYRGGGIECYLNSSVILTNCTIWGNSADRSGGGVDCFDGCSVAVTNSIVSGNTSAQGPQISVRNPSTMVTIGYSNISNGQAGVYVESGCTLDWGIGNIDADPLFAEPGYWADNNDPNIIVEPDDPNAVWIDGDYHLRSEAGRWDLASESWVFDDVTSPCIDVGDPNSDWTGEVWPHGERVNMGTYGGTREASMSTKPETMSLPHVAYVYGSDAEATESFRSLLMSYGCPTTLLGLDDVATAALDSYDLIIVADDTQHEDSWNDPNIVAALDDSGKPVVGLGDGGYDFFGLLGLSIGNPYGGHGSKNSIEVIDPNSSLFSMPYSIEIPQDRVLQLYSETHHVGIYLWPTIPEAVTVFGNEVNDIGYYPLAAEHNRYVLWGFTESPQKMTEVGKVLFINIVIHTANGTWGG